MSPKSDPEGISVDGTTGAIADFATSLRLGDLPEAARTVNKLPVPGMYVCSWRGLHDPDKPASSAYLDGKKRSHVGPNLRGATVPRMSGLFALPEEWEATTELLDSTPEHESVSGVRHDA
jgi:hypothetical protein